MALNARQHKFLQDMKMAISDLENVYGKAHALFNSYKEEFDTTSDNDLEFGTDGAGLPTASDVDILAQYYFDSGDVASACNKTLKSFTEWWEGASVVAQPNGEFARRVK